MVEPVELPEPEPLADDVPVLPELVLVDTVPLLEPELVDPVPLLEPELVVVLDALEPVEVDAAEEPLLWVLVPELPLLLAVLLLDVEPSVVPVELALLEECEPVPLPVEAAPWVAPVPVPVVEPEPAGEEPPQPNAMSAVDATRWQPRGLHVRNLGEGVGNRGTQPSSVPSWSWRNPLGLGSADESRLPHVTASTRSAARWRRRRRRHRPDRAARRGPRSS